LERYQPTAASRQDFENLAVASRVQAALMMSQSFRNLGITVKVEKGQVLVSGVFIYSVPEDEIVRLVKRIPGFTKVVADFIVISADMGEGYY
jgi:osmotically-inducible protein OsmY